MNVLKEHGFTTATTPPKFAQVNQHILEQLVKKKITALAAKNNRGSLFIFQFAAHAAGYGFSTLLTVHNLRTWPNYLEHLLSDAHLHAV